MLVITADTQIAEYANSPEIAMMLACILVKIAVQTTRLLNFSIVGHGQDEGIPIRKQWNAEIILLLIKERQLGCRSIYVEDLRREGERGCAGKVKTAILLFLKNNKSVPRLLPLQTYDKGVIVVKFHEGINSTKVGCSWKFETFFEESFSKRNMNWPTSPGFGGSFSLELVFSSAPFVQPNEPPLITCQPERLYRWPVCLVLLLFAFVQLLGSPPDT